MTLLRSGRRDPTPIPSLLDARKRDFVRLHRLEQFVPLSPGVDIICDSLHLCQLKERIAEKFYMHTVDSPDCK